MNKAIGRFRSGNTRIKQWEDTEDHKIPHDAVQDQEGRVR